MIHGIIIWPTLTALAFGFLLLAIVADILFYNRTVSAILFTLMALFGTAAAFFATNPNLF